MRNSIACFLLCVGLSACGPSKPQFTVSGHTLNVAEQNYGKADYFCQSLANGEFMVLLTDFSVCSQIHSDAGAANNKPFHAVDETNLRIIFPSTLLKVPPANTFTVAQVPGDCSLNPNGAEAVAFFSHNDPTSMKYDVNTSANAGSVTVNYNDYNQTAGELKGNFDLTFGSDHVTGSFDALNCNGVVPGTGN